MNRIKIIKESIKSRKVTVKKPNCHLIGIPKIYWELTGLDKDNVIFSVNVDMESKALVYEPREKD